ncbi:glucan endo-1 3-beta-glucosidase 14 [Phtheirospermum japonicum]|uniref:glucan endo-1,3-beta-D-glucosidase n=1 Tax=Phtheirospermum japonicum TaxID=374723 RepID=A0A830D450_9LAMI|nr:glucan endo-1 3-beta-glucosidase 14 [Phtheirospermum japonicum]
MLDSLLSSIHGLGLGVNYGRIADNIPPPPRVASLLHSIDITRVRLYDADPDVLTAFANTGVELVIEIGNELVQEMTDPAQALTWVQQKVQPFLPHTKIKSIAVGNEILTGTDDVLKSNLLPAMQSVNRAIQTLGLHNNIYVTTAHAYDIMGNSYPPSAGSFRKELVDYFQGILKFHAENKSPFLINAYPFFAYKAEPEHIPLSYVLFEPNPGMVDPGTNLHYDNMLYAQIDAVYAAIELLGFSDLEVKVSETGWPSKGDQDEVGATVQNAGLYNGNLFNRIKQNQGTPAKPNVPVDVFIFALFNENLKPGPLSERNYGLYYPDATPVYNIGSNPHPGGSDPQGGDPSGSWKNVRIYKFYYLLFFYDFLLRL